MKRILSIFLICILSSNLCHAQESAAKRAFVAGDYNTAVELYRAALAISSNDNKSVKAGLTEASICATLWQKASNAYKAKEYAVAIQNCEELLTRNPSDAKADVMIQKCKSIIDTQEQASKQREVDFRRAIKSGQSSELRLFASKYPQDTVSTLFLKYSEIDDKLTRSVILSPVEVPTITLMGKVLVKYGNESRALELFDIAISYCNCEAMYWRSFDKMLALDEIITLLSISEAGGYSAASQRIDFWTKKYSNSSIHSKQTAKKYYSALKDCDKSLDNAIYILSNCRKFPCNKTELLSRMKIILQKTENPDMHLFENIDDGRLFSAAITLNNAKYSRQMMEVAARKGNVDASLWLENHFGSKNSILGQCYEGYKEDKYSKTQQDDYVAFLKGLKVEYGAYSYLDWESRFKGNFNEDKWKEQMIRNNELLQASFYLANTEKYSNWRYKNFKQVLKDYWRWDSDIVNTCLKSIDPIGRHQGKLRRQLRKLKTIDGLYNREDNIFYHYAIAGYFDNRHFNKTPNDKIYTGKAYSAKRIDWIDYFEVDVKPTFNKKSICEFSNWVKQSLQYPKTARENGTQGTVLIGFSINTEGYVRHVNVIKSVSPELDREAVRAVSSSPRWTPGIHKGKHIIVDATIPVTFSLP